MKTPLALLGFVLALVTSPLQAADFTGTVTWAVRTDITDPELKKQMAESQAQLNDPEIQAQMKAAQEAMNDPQMQAMFKANPQMREMMEKQMKAVSKPGGGDMFPKSITLQIKGAKSLVKTEGGMGAGEVLTWGDQNVSYQIDREARSFQKLSLDAPQNAKSDQFKVTPTNETTKVLGYTCKHYRVETPDQEVKMTWSIWATDEIKGLDSSSLRRLRVGKNSGPDFFNKINGVPLKMEATMPQMKMALTATSVKPETLSDSLFALPAGFKDVSVK